MRQPDRGTMLLITPTLAGGGSERVLLNVGKGFLDLGYAVHVIVIKNQVDFTVDHRLQLRVLDWPRWILKHKIVLNLLLRIFFRRYLRAHGPFSLILSNYQSRSDFLPPMARSRLFFWIHSDYWSDIKSLLLHSPRQARKRMRQISDFFNHRNLIAVSEGAKQSLLENNRVMPARISVIYNPLDFERIRTQADASVPGIPEEPYILHVARFEPNKRHDLLFAAFSGVKAPVKLVLLAKEHEELDRLIRAHGLVDRVVVAGFQKNPFPWMKRAKLSVLSSDSGEALTMVLIESLVCGTPVVSTDCPYGPNEVLTGPLARWLVPVNDPTALRTKIEEALVSEITIDESLLDKFRQEVVLQHYVGLMETPDGGGNKEPTQRV